jgi:RNA recognition motif-containing protein
LNINFINLEQDMTNGGFLYFSNTAEIKKAINILSNFNLFGMKLFYVKKYPNNSLFYKIQIKSFIKLNLEKIKKINSGNIEKYLGFYDKKLKFNYTDAVDDEALKIFIENIEHIKCTGIHINTGVIIYENLKKNKLILKNKIENHKIFNLIENHFK